MANTYFEFKQFRINQENCAMKVGTDGVLLGAWANVEKASQILDIGTGTGLIALMLAQRTQDASIIGVEFDEQAFTQAQRNVSESPWKSRLELVNTKVQEYENTKAFDHIVSNPPFFVASQKAPEANRNLARHNDSLSFDDLLKAAKSLLQENGRFSVVYPASEAEIFIDVAAKYGFCLNRLCKVYPTPTKAVRRYLMEFSMREQGLIEESIILEIGKRHVYSPEYIALTKDFYLKF